MSSLRNIYIFSDLQEQDLINLEALVIKKNLTKNEVVISYLEHSSSVYFVLEGLVRSTTYSMTGREVTFQDLGPGEMFGELSAIDGKERTTSVIALEDSLVGIMSSTDLWDLIIRYPSVMKNVVYRLTGLIRFLVSRVFEYSTLNVNDRVRSEILRYARQNMTGEIESTIYNLPTHEVLAHQLATHREAVTKEINYLVKNKFIEKRGKIVIVPDINKLQALFDQGLQ